MLYVTTAHSDHCKGTGMRKDVLTIPLSLCQIQYSKFENNKKKKIRNKQKPRIMVKTNKMKWYYWERGK